MAEVILAAHSDPSAHVSHKLGRRLRRHSSAILGLLMVALAATAAAAQVTPSVASVEVASKTALPHDLNPWSMFVNADGLVQAILVGLALASVVTWTIWLAKSLELMTAKRRARAALVTLRGVADLPVARRALAGRPSAAGHFVEAASGEVERSGAGMPIDGIKERIGLGLQRIEASHVRRIQRGTGILATIGATAPFVGLFGTVWGIMNSFVGIARMQTTNLAVVAPGIAEALLATAVGLAAAIPAVIVYNIFSRSIAGYRATMTDASAEVMRLASRDLDRHGAGRMAVSDVSRRAAE